MAALIQRGRRKRRAAQRAARQEILTELQENPIGAYGLYHLMEDAGLLDAKTKEELAPSIARVEQRLSLRDEDLIIALPLPFEPITDIEHDTLTLVIGDALREFAQGLPDLNEPLRLAQLLGINDMLERHLTHTASISYEVSLEQILVPLLLHCADRLPYYRPDRLCNAQPQDFFRITNLKRSKQKFSSKFILERALQEQEIVCLEDVWPKGYMQVQRFTYTASYSKTWTFYRIGKSIPKKAHLTVVHNEEGMLYRLHARYDAAVRRLIDLYSQHREDYSPDATTYQPIGPRKPSST